MLRILFCLTLAATLLNACTIEKRTFRNGWHVEWKKRHSVTETSEKETAVAAIRTDEPVVPVESEEVSVELVAETAVSEERTVPSEAIAEEAVLTDEISDTDPTQSVTESVISGETLQSKRILPLNPPPKGEIDDTGTTASGWWWIVALLVGIAIASAVWLAVGTGGSSGLLVALFVALVGSVVGAIVVSMRIKDTTPKEPEEDIQFDDLTENEIKRKKKLKGLIAALVLVVVATSIILIGSK